MKRTIFPHVLQKSSGLQFNHLVQTIGFPKISGLLQMLWDLQQPMTFVEESIARYLQCFTLTEPNKDL